MVGTKIYQYNAETGVYERSYGSKTELEQELHLYRGAASDYLKSEGKSERYLFSLTKYDLHPKFSSNQFSSSDPMISEEDLRAKHDKYFVISSFVTAMPVGKFIDEINLLRQLGMIGKPGFRDALSRPELKEYRGKADGVIYYGNSTSIKKLKSEGVLQ